MSRKNREKLGRWYVAAWIVATALAIASIYILESKQQAWVLAHPILAGTIGGAVIVPISGVVALAVIDRRIATLTRKSLQSRIDQNTERLRMCITQVLRGGILGAIGMPQQEPVLMWQDVITLLKEAGTWERPPTSQEMHRVNNVVLPYMSRCTDVAKDLAFLTENDRLMTFADFIVDGMDFIRLSIEREQTVQGTAKPSFYAVYTSVLEVVANMAHECCPAALPLVLSPSNARSS